MNFIPRHVALVSLADSDASFAESTVSTYGLEVARYDSTTALTRDVQQRLASADPPDSGTPELAIVAGSTGAAGESANEAFRQLAELVPVVVTSSTSNVGEAVELMKQGATDVVPLPCPREELWDRVRRSLQQAEARNTHRSQASLMRARLNLLTPAEHAVVNAMLDGLANKQIAQRLGIGLRTVELRRSKVMRKMQAKSVAELVKFICLAGGLKGDASGSEQSEN